MLFPDQLSVTNVVVHTLLAEIKGTLTIAARLVHNMSSYRTYVHRLYMKDRLLHGDDVVRGSRTNH